LQPRPELDVLADQPPQHLVHLAHHDVQVEHPGLQHLLATEGQELARETGRALGRLDDFTDLARERVAARQAAGDHVPVPHDDAQYVEVVRHPAGQAPDGLHLLRLPKLLREPTPLRYVAG
jgi:hypothetical protein